MIDHIVPVTGPDDPRFWDMSNHQALCSRAHGCHDRKRQREGRTGGIKSS
jgi:5-methylcytosine-specific restriction endonuclease McrA